MKRLRQLGLFCLLLGVVGCSRSTAYWVEQARASEPAQRLHAVHALRDRVNEGEVVLPVLTAALDDDDTSVRRDAARALGHFGAAAQTAVPALKAHLRDREPSVRKAAAQALQEIDPNAAPRGPKRERTAVLAPVTSVRARCQAPPGNRQPVCS